MFSTTLAILTCLNLIDPAVSLSLFVGGERLGQVTIDPVVPTIFLTWDVDAGDPPTAVMALERTDSAFQVLLADNVDLSLGQIAVSVTISPLVGEFTMQALSTSNTSILLAESAEFNLTVVPNTSSSITVANGTASIAPPSSTTDRVAPTAFSLSSITSSASASSSVVSLGLPSGPATLPINKRASPVGAIVGGTMAGVAVLAIGFIFFLKHRRRSQYPTVDPLIREGNLSPPPTRRNSARKARPQITITDPLGQTRGEKMRIRDQHDRVQSDLEANMLRREENRRSTSGTNSPISPTEIDLRQQLQILQDRILILESQQDRSASATPPPDYALSETHTNASGH